MTTARRHPVVPSTARRHRGFTLVEMVVVIGVILLLVSLLVAVFPRFLQRAEVGRTETTLQVLTVALSEWEATADRKLSFGVNGTPPAAIYDLHTDVPHVFLLTELLEKIRRNAEVSQILAQIAPDVLLTYDTSEAEPQWIASPSANDPDPLAGQASSVFSGGLGGRPVDGMMTVLDAWGTPIRIIHPGRKHDLNAPFNDPALHFNADGTLFLDASRTGLEEFYGVAANRRVCFVSAGPDKEFGNLHLDTKESDFAGTDRDDADRAADNVYSYPVVTRRPQPDGAQP